MPSLDAAFMPDAHGDVHLLNLPCLPVCLPTDTASGSRAERFRMRQMPAGASSKMSRRDREGRRGRKRGSRARRRRRSVSTG